MSDNQRLLSALTFVAPARQPKLMNALALAYVGDAVYEMYVRQYVLGALNHKPNHLHRSAIRFVSAKAQAQFLERWLPLLSEEEHDVVRRGRNANSGTVPKNVDLLAYRHATGLEALIGYLYLEQRFTRLNELMDVIFGKEE